MQLSIYMISVNFCHSEDALMQRSMAPHSQRKPPVSLQSSDWSTYTARLHPQPSSPTWGRQGKDQGHKIVNSIGPHCDELVGPLKIFVASLSCLLCPWVTHAKQTSNWRKPNETYNNVWNAYCTYLATYTYTQRKLSVSTNLNRVPVLCKPVQAWFLFSKVLTSSSTFVGRISWKLQWFQCQFQNQTNNLE